MDKTLHLSVWHNDSRGRNVFLGQVELKLKTWDWGHEALTWYNLLPKVNRASLTFTCHDLTPAIWSPLRSRFNIEHLNVILYILYNIM